MMDTGYKKLDIYKLSYDLAIKVHRITLTLPKFATYEEESQIHRSSKSIPVNIVERYCLRRHKNEYLQYLHRASGSSQETIVHLNILHDTQSLSDENTFSELSERYDHLGRMIFRFIESIIAEHLTPNYVKENNSYYES
ncbi:MAG: four helix bundle protein [Chlorobiaceae bacterium]|nr:four helix bundle protein [Chlorobiaceae bacterium]